MSTIEIFGTPIALPDAEWTDRERDNWEWRQPLKCSEWAELYRELTEQDADRVGPWRNENAPYLRGIMDIGFAPGVRELCVPKAAQVGASEAGRNILGYIAHHDPSPTGMVLPDKEKGRQIVADRILPFFRNTPVLARLMTDRAHDAKASQLKLRNAFNLYLMWSGSASSLASHPIRYGITDEIDKFAPSAGKEADGLSLFRKRQRTYGNRAKLWKWSTPTTRVGPIWQEHENADFQLFFLVPCPHCGARQRLIRPQLKWEKPEGIEDPNRLAAYILAHKAAWYECLGCGARIHSREKRRMIQLGAWGTCDETGMADGAIDDAEAIEKWPEGTLLSMHVPAMCAIWVGFEDVAAEAIRSDPANGGSLEALFEHVTQTLGEPFEQKLAKVEANTFKLRSQDARLAEGVLPWWTAALIAAIDTQNEGFWLTIRAWGPGMRSQRVFHGWIPTEEELDYLMWGKPWSNEDERLPARTVDLALIDSGGTKTEGQLASRTMDVYRYALERAPYVRAIKGDARPREGLFIRKGQGWLRGDQDRSTEVPLWLIDSQHYQDELAELINRQVRGLPDDDGEVIEEHVWQLNQRNDPVYNQQMSNLHKVAVRESGKLVESWIPVTPGARHDLRDCEGYQVAAAYMQRVNLLPSLADYAAMIEHELKMADRPAELRGGGGPRGLTTPDGRNFMVTQRR